MSTAAYNWVILVVVLVLIGLTVAVSQLDARYGYRRKLGWIWEQQIKASPWWDKLWAVVRIVFGIAAAGLFLTSLAINICTWVYPGVARCHGLFWMHIGVLLVCFTAFAFNRRSRGITLSKWASRFVSAMFLYFVILFVSGFLHSDGAHNHGKQNGESQSGPNSRIELEMDSKSHSQEDLLGIRTASALWIAFSFVSAAGLLWAKGEGYKGPFGKYNRVVQ